MKKLLLSLLFLLLPFSGFAQNFVEIRGASTRYRYAEFNHTFSNHAVFDFYYVGVPGSNEFDLGGGYNIRLKKNLTLTPLIYAAIAKENEDRGLKLALLLNYEGKLWKINCFIAEYTKLAGKTTHYQVLDTLDLTRTIARHWEVGLSHGFFLQDSQWNPQTGPILKRNDTRGSWAVPYRFGPQNEFRIGRTFTY